MAVKFDHCVGGLAVSGLTVTPNPPRLVSYCPSRCVLVTLKASTRICSLCITAKQLRRVNATTCRAGIDRLDAHHIALRIPVCGPTSVVKDTAVSIKTDRQARVPAVDA